MVVFATYDTSTTFVATPSSFTKLLVVLTVSYPFTGLTPLTVTRPNHRPGALRADFSFVADTPRRLLTDLPVNNTAERLMLAGTW